MSVKSTQGGGKQFERTTGGGGKNSASLPLELQFPTPALSVHLKIKIAAINGKTLYIATTHGKRGSGEQSTSHAIEIAQTWRDLSTLLTKNNEERQKW